MKQGDGLMKLVKHICEDCGAEFVAGTRARFGPECRRKRNCESSRRYMDRKRKEKALQPPEPPTRLSILREQRAVLKERESMLPKKEKVLKRMKKVVCGDCGKEFVASPGARYCPECRNTRMQADTLATRRCVLCGKEFVGGPRSLYCQECGIKKRRERWRHYMERRKAGTSIVLGETVRKCEACGKPFVMLSSSQKLCPACMEKARH